MGIRETADAFIAGINVLDVDATAPYCADNFSYSGPFPKPVSLQEWRGMAAVFRNAFPDWRFNAQVERVEGDIVHLTVHPSGTHTGDLDLTALGSGVIPASGKSFALPLENARLTFKGDKIVNFHLDVTPGGGIPGILSQLGVEMPKGTS